MWGAIAAVGGSILSNYLSGKSARRAAAAQGEGFQKGIDFFNKFYNEAKGNYQPYINAGSDAIKSLPEYSKAGLPALNSIMDLAGLSGNENQANAIKSIEQSPYAQYLFKQGEDAMLQNASATGGLRGGNTQSLLANFRPQVLNDLIDKQYSRLGDLMTFGRNNTAQLADMGQNAVSGISNIGLNVGSNLANLYTGKAGADMNMIDAKNRSSWPNLLLSGLNAANNAGLGGKVSQWFSSPNTIGSGIGSFFKNNLPFARNTQ
jgi:hypothetical protein